MAIDTTTYRGYKKPSLGYTGTPDWGTLFNDNAALIDSDIGTGYTPAGLEADLPASPSVGDTYLATDTGVFWKCFSDGVWTGTIAAAEIPSSSVTTAKLADNAITAAKITSGAVGSAAIGAGAVTADKLATESVLASAFASGAVTADKIADGAVNSAAIAAGAVTTAKIADGSVTAEKVAQGAISLVGIAEGDGADVYTSSGTWVAVSGLSVTATTRGGTVLVVFAAQLQPGSGANTMAQATIFIDGANVGQTDGLAASPWVLFTAIPYMTTSLSAGLHTFAAYFRSSVSGDSVGINPWYLMVLEIVG